MTSNPRHGLPPRLMAHQPTRFATAQESKPSPSPGIRVRSYLPLLNPFGCKSDEEILIEPLIKCVQVHRIALVEQFKPCKNVQNCVDAFIERSWGPRDFTDRRSI